MGRRKADVVPSLELLLVSLASQRSPEEAIIREVDADLDTTGVNKFFRRVSRATVDASRVSRTRRPWPRIRALFKNAGIVKAEEGVQRMSPLLMRGSNRRATE